ncbi:MAG: TetR/AcrR family transcriptional regulator [Clostridia bacterium]|nr:TetR/AcrR family transcriptional regulator [Clostridia bacterium]
MNKKDQIYEAAIKLFNKNGFDKTPTSQIAKEAGVAIGTLFHYFKTKEELINSLYLKCKESMINRTISGVNEEKTYIRKVKRIYVNFLEWGMEFTDEFLFFQQFSSSVHIYDATRTEGKSKFEVLMDIFREGMEAEIIKKVPENYLLSITSAMMMSNINYFINNRELLEDKDFVEETFSFLWKSIKN